MINFILAFYFSLLVCSMMLSPISPSPIHSGILLHVLFLKFAILSILFLLSNYFSLNSTIELNLKKEFKNLIIIQTSAKYFCVSNIISRKLLWILNKYRVRRPFVTSFTPRMLEKSLKIWKVLWENYLNQSTQIKFSWARALNLCTFSNVYWFFIRSV